MRDDVARALAARALEVAQKTKSQQGPKGEKGDAGQIIVQPNKGDKGDTGLMGPQGIPGKSITGPKGDKGDKGDAGQKGDTGQKGDAGDKGDKGERGERGFQGVKGLDGSKGDIGPMPKHEKKGLMIRFEKEPGTWGEWIIMPTSGGGGGGRDDKLTDRQAELVALAEFYKTRGSNANKYIKTDGTTLSWDTLDGSDINLASPPAIGGTTPNAGSFTTLNSTGGALNGTIGATSATTVNATTITGQTGVLRGTGQNLLLWSDDFSNAVWGAVSANVTRTTTTIDFTNATAYAYQQGISAVAGIAYTFSVTLSSTNKTAIAIRIAGSSTGGSNQSLITLTSTPTKYSVTYTLASGNSAVDVGFDNRVAQGGNGSLGLITVSNAQLEIGSVVNTYVATTSSRVYGTPTLSFSGVSEIGLLSTGALYLQPAGTGALQAQATTSTTAGGNARGANAVDWQTNRSSASQVASGQYGAIAGGQNNTASGYATFAAGANSTASNTYGFVGSGNSNNASGYGASIVGGYTNAAAGFFNFIGNGFTNSGTSGSAVTTQSGTMNATTAVTLSGSNANIKVGQLITGTSINSFPNTYVAAISGTSLTLSQAASGSSTSTLSFFTPHGVVVGGGNNQATGSYSFIGGGGDAGTAANRNVASGDWSFVGGGWGNQATGIGAFVGGGGVNSSTAVNGNTASGISSVVGGGNINTASAQVSFVGSGAANTANAIGSSVLGGYRGTTRGIQGISVFPSSVAPLGANNGVSQSALLVLAVQTTDATPTALRSNSSAAGTTNQVILPNNSAYFFTGEVVSGVTGGGDTKGWTIEGVIKRGANAASTALVGTPTVTSTYADAGASAWAIAVTADTTNGGLRVTFTGQAATTIRTVCSIRSTEMTF